MPNSGQQTNTPQQGPARPYTGDVAKVAAPTFTGDEEAIRGMQQFLADFWAYTQTIGATTDKQRWAALAYSLRGSAKEWYHNTSRLLDGATPTWDDFVERISHRFQIHGGTKFNSREGRHLNQRPDESARDFHQRCLTFAITQLDDKDYCFDKFSRVLEHREDRELQKAKLMCINLQTHSSFLAGCHEALGAEVRRHDYDDDLQFLKAVEAAEATLLASGLIRRTGTTISAIQPGVPPAHQPPQLAQSIDAIKPNKQRCKHCNRTNHKDKDCWFKDGKRRGKKPSSSSQGHSNSGPAYGGPTGQATPPAYGMAELAAKFAALEAMVKPLTRPDF